jgi:hypothetical protein
MNESPKTFSSLPLGVVMGCKSMLKRLLAVGGASTDGGLLCSGHSLKQDIHHLLDHQVNKLTGS